MKTKNFTLPKPDDKGRYRPVVGRNDYGKPQRFQVGTVRTTTAVDAQRRLDYIRHLYEKQCHHLNIDYWEEGFLPWALRIAAEGQVKVYGSKQSEKPAGAAQELGEVHFLQAWGLPIIVEDQGLAQCGYSYLQDQIKVAVNDAVALAIERLGYTHGEEIIEAVQRKVIPDDLNGETKSFHEALTAYGKYIEATGITYRSHVRLSRLKYLKKHHEDLPLWRLNLPECEKIVAYWRNRPLTIKGKRCTGVHSENMIKELYAFFGWLDTEPSFKWVEPKGLRKIDRTPIKLPEDNNGKTAFQTINKDIFSVEQLKILAEHSDDYGKALIGLCVNCAFGASEIGQWQKGGFSLFTAHPFAEHLGITSTDQDSWCVGNRPKTSVYGEHWLFPQVAKAIKPFIEDGRETFCITETGKPLYRVHSKNPQSGFQKRWNFLLDRVQKKHPHFPRLPFGTLRDQLPNLLRQKFGNDVADMALQHGDPKEHNLLKCYSNTPYNKLFDATKALEEHFKLFLNSLARSWEG